GVVAGVCVLLVVPVLVAVGLPLVGAGRRVVTACVVYQVRWVGRQQRCQLTVHEAVNVLGVGRVAAEQAVITQEPEVTWLGDGLSFRFGKGSVEVERLWL